jgi:AraC-like DNA-binding protein
LFGRHDFFYFLLVGLWLLVRSLASPRESGGRKRKSRKVAGGFFWRRCARSNAADTIDQVAARVGFGDPERMRRTFVRIRSAAASAATDGER